MNTVKSKRAAVAWMLATLGAGGCGGDAGSDPGPGPVIAVQPPVSADAVNSNPAVPTETNNLQPPSGGMGPAAPVVMPGADDPDTSGPDTSGPDTSGPDASGPAQPPGDDQTGETPTEPVPSEPFSFFVTSLDVMRELSGSPDGFGGNLGGLEGADSICQQAAAKVGFGGKTWRAFLSVTDGGDGNPVHAIDRIGQGPWYDRNGRLIADNIQGLLATRPAGDPQTINDLPDEFGTPLTEYGDSHDVVTGTNTMGQLDSTDPTNTCNDWTSTTVKPAGGNGETSENPRPGGGFPGFPGGGFPPGGFGSGIRVGHAWPAQSGQHWMTAHAETSCAPGVNLVQNGPGDGSSIGAGGGWGAFYCFALQP